MNLLPDAPTQASSEEPMYNIGVVTRMTGISMATLRAWERRYDFPQSGRTIGGHRLYSEKDVMRLRWVKARIEDGMQTAQAIHALRFQEDSGQFVTELPPTLEPMPQTGERSTLSIYQQALIQTLVQRDLIKADQILSEAAAIATPESLILNLLGPAMATIGEAWEHKRITIATEHLATNYLRQRLIMWMLSGPPPMQKPPIVLACAPDEWHEGSLLMLGALLRRRRWPIAYLGQAVPLLDLASFVRDLKPSLVVLVAMSENTARQLVDWPQWLPEVSKTGKPILAYGGRIFTLQPEWRMRMPGIFLGASLLNGLEEIEKLIQ